ncbi:IS3 family transposase [Bacillus sp. SA1-12]|uniref:IS3 family transposase n=1 Tax=Bacillus sp. SA1-12 TaxID=1455638 RepID=UPI000A07C8E0
MNFNINNWITNVNYVSDRSRILNLIKQIYDEKSGKSGERDIRMVLENDYFTVMNLKKFYRIMNKFNLKSNTTFLIHAHTYYRSV